MSRLWLFALIASVFLVALSMYPTYRDFRATPPDRVFMGTHNNPLDYPMFVAAINRAQRGSWCNKAVFASESQPCDFVHWIYIPLGKLTQLLNNLSFFIFHFSFFPNSQLAIYTYQFGRVLFGLTLALSTFYFISTLFNLNHTERKISYKNKRGSWIPFLRKFTQPAEENLVRLKNVPVAGEYVGSAQTNSPSNSIAKATTGSEKIGIKNPVHLLSFSAFLLSLFSAGFTRFARINGRMVPDGPYLSWWSGGDVLQRATFQPHAMLKNTLLLLILVLFSKIFAPKKLLPITYCLLPILGFLLGLHDPMNSLSILGLLGVYSLFQFFKHRFNVHKTISKLHTTTLILYSLFSVSGLYLTYWAFKYTPWKSVSDWESHQFYPVPFWEYANHLGPIFYLGIPGLFLLSLSTLLNNGKNHKSQATNHNEIPNPKPQKYQGLNHWNLKHLLGLVTWSLRLDTYPNRFLIWSSTLLTFGSIFFILSGISRFLGLSTLRFFQTPVHIFLSIGTVYLIYVLVTFVFGILNLKNWNFVGICSLVIVILSVTIPAYPLSIKSQLSQWSPVYWDIYMDRDSYSVLRTLREISRPDDVVLSNDLVGRVVPTVAGNNVYIGHYVSTPNFQAKKDQALKFLNNQLTSEQELNLMKSSRAKYVIVMQPETSIFSTRPRSFLKLIRTSGSLSLYQVN